MKDLLDSSGPERKKDYTVTQNASGHNVSETVHNDDGADVQVPSGWSTYSRGIVETSWGKDAYPCACLWHRLFSLAISNIFNITHLLPRCEDPPTKRRQLEATRRALLREKG